MAGFSFSSLFGGGSGGIQHNGSGVATPIPTANPQQQLANGQAAGTTGGNPVSGAQATQPAPKPEDSLLASMQSLWQTPTTADGKPAPAQVDPLTQQIHSFDPAKVAEASKRLDFTKSIPDDVIVKALSGDTSAFRQAMNEALQQSFTGSTVNTATLINQGFDKYGKLVDAALPDRIKDYQIQTTTSEDPILSHPAVAPLMAALKGVAKVNKPGASAVEIQSTAEDFLKGFATLMATKQQDGQQAQAAEKEPDWMAFAGLGPRK